MGKIKLGRLRKYTHRKYSKVVTGNDGTSLQKPLSSTLPLKFQFSLRDVPLAVLNDPSIYNYTRVFNILLKDKIFKSQWNLIKHSDLFLMLCCFTTETEKAPVPHKTITVNTDFTWNVIASNKSVNEAVHGIPQRLEMVSFINLLEFVDGSITCPGIVDEQLKQLSVSGGRHGVFKDRHGGIKARLIGNSTIRYTECQGIVKLKTLCEPCKLYKKNLQTMLSNIKSRNADQCQQGRTMVGGHCPWKHLSEQEKIERINNCREQRHSTAKKIKCLEEKFKEDLIALNNDDDEVMQNLLGNIKDHNVPEDFKSLFLHEQQKILSCTDKRARRWHPLIIRWCFQLHSSSPKAYEMLKDSGIIILPDKRTLHDYSNCFKSNVGFDPVFFDVVKKDFISRSSPREYDHWVGIIHDEVSLRKDIVFDDSGKLIGFVDLGSTQNCIDDLERSLSSKDDCSHSPQEATHMFVFMVSSLFSEWKMPLAFFPTTTIKSFALFNVFWHCVEELELREFKVLTSTCDGASPHRKFYKYHSPPGAPKGTLVHKTTNPYAYPARSLFFICDPVHLLKTTRNNWENSFWRNKTRKLKNNNMWITWLQLIDVFENDINESNASGLRILNKLSTDHLFLNPYLRMRVYLAAQVFSNRVACAITLQGKAGTEETAKFVKHMNDFFDCFNANRVVTQLEFKSVYRSPVDRRLLWLQNDFLKYFQDWKDWAMTQTDVSLKERKQYFISDQTWEGLQICIKSFVEVIQYSLSVIGVEYVVATKFNQDPLEKFFGKLRQKRGAYGAFTCKEFSQSFTCASFSNSHGIKTIRRLKRNGGDLESLDSNFPLSKQKRE